MTNDAPIIYHLSFFHIVKKPSLLKIVTTCQLNRSTQPQMKHASFHFANYIAVGGKVGDVMYGDVLGSLNRCT